MFGLGDHLGWQQGAKGEIPAQTGIGGAHRCLLSDGAKQVCPLARGAMRQPPRASSGDPGTRAVGFGEGDGFSLFPPGIFRSQLSNFFFFFLPVLLSLPYFSVPVRLTHEVTYLAAPIK